LSHDTAFESAINFAPMFAASCCARAGEALRENVRELGLQNVRIDKEGNVLGERPGAQPRPRLVFTAHLDTS